MVARVDHLLRRAVEPYRSPHQTETGTAQAIRIEELCVVDRDVRRPGKASLPTEGHAAGGWIATVESAALNHAQRDRRVCDGTPVWTHRILRVRDGHNTSATGEADRGFDADYVIGIRRADDAAVRLGAKRQGREVGRLRGARAGT
jgi:hypothetical protein